VGAKHGRFLLKMAECTPSQYLTILPSKGYRFRVAAVSRASTAEDDVVLPEALEGNAIFHYFFTATMTDFMGDLTEHSSLGEAPLGEELLNQSAGVVGKVWVIYSACGYTNRS
jgi:hypothetical protein